MKAALLVCDHVSDELVTDHGTYVDMFQQLLPELSLEPFFVVDNFFPDPEEFDVFIATGSKSSVYDPDPWIRNLLDFIREVDQLGKKMVGVCFGHQAIAEALGGKVEKADLGYLIGIRSFDVLGSPSWMQPKRDQYNILMLCQDQVHQLPSGSVLLASNEKCPHGMFQIKNQFLGIQGHPEFSKAYNRAIFEKRLRKVDEERVDAAITSFSSDPDQALLVSWIMGFLKA